MITAKRWPNTRRPRQERDSERIRRAAAWARRTENAAMAVALAEIGAAFDEAAVNNAFKLRVEWLLRLGPHHQAVRARFGGRAALLQGRNLDAAVATVERWWRDEQKAFQIASAFGRATRLSLEVLRELRLIMRLLRLTQTDAEFRTILEALCDEPLATAAE